MRSFGYINGKYDKLDDSIKLYDSSNIELKNVDNFIVNNKLNSSAIILSMELDSIVTSQRVFTMSYDIDKKVIVNISNNTLILNIDSTIFNYTLSAKKLNIEIYFLKKNEIVVDINGEIIKNVYAGLFINSLNNINIGSYETNKGITGKLFNLELKNFIWCKYDPIEADTIMDTIKTETLEPTFEPYECFYNVEYTDRYNKDKPYPTYEIGKEILSTHYKLEIDLSKEPFGYDYVINEPLARMYYNLFEAQRPVVRVAHYSITNNFFTDLTGKEYNIYKGSYNVYWKSRFVLGKQIKKGYFVEDNRDDPKDEWEINHDLKSIFVIVQCYDTNFKLVKPIVIEAIDHKNVYIKFDKPVAGFAVISVPDWIEQFHTPLAEWNLYHNINSPYNYLTQETDDGLSVMNPAEIVHLNVGRMDILYYQDIMGNSYVSNTDFMENVNDSYDVTITHNKNMNAIYLEAYDKNDKKIIPDVIKILDENTVYVKFKEKLSGRIVIKFIGRLFFYDDILDKFENGTVRFGDENDPLWGYGEEWVDAEGLIDIKKVDVKHEIYRTNVKKLVRQDDGFLLYFEVPQEMYLNLSIKEIGFFDSSDEMMFYLHGHEIFKIEEMGFDGYIKIHKEKITAKVIL